MRGSAGGLEKLSAGVSGLVKKRLDCTVASVGRQIDVYRPIKIQISYRPTVFFNVIAALVFIKRTDKQKMIFAFNHL